VEVDEAFVTRFGSSAALQFFTGEAEPDELESGTRSEESEVLV
jgi:hypothetical protein